MARKGVKLVDLCKVNTDAFRHMTDAQLKRAEQTMGTYFGFNSKTFDKVYALIYNPRSVRKLPPRKSEIGNRIVSQFVNELRSSREPYDPAVEPHYEAAARKNGREPRPFSERKEIQKKRVDRIERAIWDLQSRLACPIKPRELVARDAAREGRPELVAKIRGKAHIK